MKKVLKVFSILFLVCFSFYYTEKIAHIMQSKDELMLHINKVKENYNVASVNAVINEDTIIPGINGVIVNSQKSYSKMKSLNVFNEYYLEYEQVKPVISLSDNKDKTIIKGNKNKNAVAILVKNNSLVKDYLTKEGYVTDYKNICVVDLDKICNDNVFRARSSLIINHQNILTSKGNVESGDIILIEENVSVSELKILLEEIKYRDLKIISLNSLISEENNIN